MSSYRTILPFLRQNLWHYVLGILSLLFVDAASLVVPQILKRFADWAQFQELSSERAGYAALMIIGLGLCVAAGRYGWRTQIFGTARKLDYWLRDKLFAHYLTLDDRFFNTHRTGDLMASLTNDIFMVRNTLGGGIIMVVDAVFMSLFTVVMMVATVGIKTTLVALIALPFLSLAVFLMSKPLQKRSRDVQDSFAAMTTEVQENISGIHNIKAFSVEENRSASFAGVSDDYRGKNLKLIRLSAIFHPLIEVISGTALVAFILYGLGRINAGEMTLGDFVAVIHYLRMMIWPLLAIGMVVGSFQRGVAAMSRINEILAAKATVQESSDPLTPDGDKTVIEFHSVRFRYEKDLPYVLDGVSFTVKPGEKVAILGRTGSGKTTIINLLTRRYDVSEGKISINGKDIRDLALAELYRRIAYVEQESFLFSRSIADNIAFSTAGGADMEKVRAAAQFSQVEKDIEAMADGYETWVGERGVTLSGGQKQRVAIARAYYKDAEVLILDDSLSAVDTATEQGILDRIDRWKRSLIIVSQRVSTVQRADKILILEEGKITQSGSHEELLKEEDGFYARLYRRQLLESKLNETRREAQA